MELMSARLTRLLGGLSALLSKPGQRKQTQTVCEAVTIKNQILERKLQNFQKNSLAIGRNYKAILFI